MKKAIIYFLIVGGVLGAMSGYRAYQASKAREALGGATGLDAFAQCLTQKGAIMYGADWCPHCKNEKRGFGDSFKYVTYVECPSNPQKCQDAGITGYPTWLFPGGGRYEGEQGVVRLAEISGCQLAEDNPLSTPEASSSSPADPGESPVASPSAQ